MTARAVELRISCMSVGLLAVEISEKADIAVVKFGICVYSEVAIVRGSSDSDIFIVYMYIYQLPAILYSSIFIQRIYSSTNRF